jgi:hypothetical protein
MIFAMQGAAYTGIQEMLAGKIARDFSEVWEDEESWQETENSHATFMIAKTLDT